MGRMGYGYGSEFHLLRWMGRHREDFTKRVSKVVKCQIVRWFDFDFNNGNPIPDEEIKGFSFLDDEKKDLLKRVQNKQSRLRWPGGGRSISWDAVGQTDDGRFVICEAKAHKKELISSIYQKTDPKSKETIFGALEETKKHIGVSSSTDWRKKYYQFANRLYVQAVLDCAGIDAVLLNIYFLGDSFPNDKTQCPVTQAEWEEAIAEEYKTLGIPRNGNAFIEKHVLELFLPVAKLTPRGRGPWGRCVGIVQRRGKTD